MHTRYDSARCNVSRGRCGRTHSDPLLLAAREHVHPVLDGVPAALALHQVRQLNDVQESLQLGVSAAAPRHLLARLRVDHLSIQIKI